VGDHRDPRPVRHLRRDIGREALRDVLVLGDPCGGPGPTKPRRLVREGVEARTAEVRVGPESVDEPVPGARRGPEPVNEHHIDVQHHDLRGTPTVRLPDDAAGPGLDETRRGPRPGPASL